MKQLILFWIGCCLVLCVSCVDDEIPEFDQGYVEGYRPVYQVVNLDPQITSAKNFNSPGKIYTYGRLILISEPGQGFHILDNTDPSNPIKTGFFEIPFNNNIAIRDNIVYADSRNDLLAIAVQGDGSLEVQRSEGVFDDAFPTSTPPVHGYYFECVEDDQGIVVDWELTTLYDPQCYY